MKTLRHALRGRPDEARFAELFLKEFRALGKQARFSSEHFAILVEPGPSTLNLHNFYREYVAAPRFARARLLGQQFRALLSLDEPIPKQWSEVRARLLPLIRHRSELEYARLKARIGGNNFEELGRPFSSFLYESIAYDTPTSILRGSASMLDDWGVSFETAWDAAQQNLRSISQNSWSRVHPGVFQSTWRDTYDASRVLLTDLICRLPLNGRPVAFLPERNVLLITSEGNMDGLRFAAESAARILAKAPRPLTAEAIVLDSQRWLPFSLPPEVGTTLGSALLAERAEAYESSTELMRELFEAHGTDVFVGSVLRFQSQENDKETQAAVWTQDCDTLLPVADIVAMHDSDETIYVPWSVLEEHSVLPHAEQEWWPPRYRVMRFPDEPTMQLLRARRAI